MIDLKQYAEQRGILIGVTSAEPLPPVKGVTEQRRLDPRLALPAAKSVIVIGVPIRGGKREAGGPADIQVCPLRGQVAAAMSGADYHETVTAELNALASRLGAHEYALQADSGPLYERGFAIRAGVAFQGRNSCVFSDKYGSYFNIGLLLTPLELPQDAPNTAYCPNCGACVSACPNNALAGGFERERCLASITQKKGELTEAEQTAMGDRLWGCDVCQRVCPLNQGKLVDGDSPLLDDIDALTDESFAARFPAAAWRGLGAFKRNAAIVRQNIT